VIAEALKPLTRPIDGLKLDPANARLHNERNLNAIKASLNKFGQQKPIVALPDGTVIAGNGTLEAAKALGWSEIAVSVFKGSAIEAKAYALADNRTAELAEWDNDELSDAVKWLSEQPDETILDDLFSEIELRVLTEDGFVSDNTTDSEWKQMPELNQSDLTPLRQIIISFKTEVDIQKFSELIGQTITPKTRSVWYPKAEIETMMDKVYISES
jgi:hypothetical protein